MRPQMALLHLVYACTHVTFCNPCWWYARQQLSQFAVIQCGPYDLIVFGDSSGRARNATIRVG